jgi:Ca2+-binding RTX toxin-like protein
MRRVGTRLGGRGTAGAVAGFVLWLSLAISSPAFAAVAPGEIFVADPEAGPGSRGAILRIDRASGAQTVVSSGGQFQNPVGVAVGGAGELFVADADALGGTGAVFRVDPVTGAQQVVASDGAFEEPTGIATSGGGIAVADPDAKPPDPSAGDGGVIYVDPETGRQTRGQGPTGDPLVDPSGLVLPAGGGLIFTDANSGEGGSGVVYALTLVTRGAFVTLPIASGGNLVDPIGIALVPSGFAAEGVVVADPNAAGGTGAVIGLSDPQRVWASGGDFSDPTGVAFRPGSPSEVLVVDQSAGASGAVFSVDPRPDAQASGAQAPVSSGGSFAQPTGIAVAPPLCKGRFAQSVGSEGPDLIGAGGVVAALGGDDEVHGDDTDDLVCGDEGDDLIASQVGVALSYGDDEYLGGDGDDKLVGGSGGFEGGRDKLAGGAGNDKGKGNGDRDRVTGGDGNDRLSGGGGKDRVGGGKGRDLLRGGKGGDVLKGGKGRDRCVGGPGDDRAAGCERKRKT